MTPLTRGTLLDTLLAFKRTAMMRTGVELRLFDALAAGPLDAAEVARAAGAPVRSVRVLLGAMASAGLLVESADGRYGLVEGADRLLVTSSPEYAGDAVLVAASYAEWDAMRDLSAVVRSGGTLLEVDAGSPAFRYWDDFAAHGTFATKPLAAALGEALTGWAAARDEIRVLDVGCGHGLFGLLFAAGRPGARVCGVDRDGVLVHARKNAEALGLTDRATWIAGDAFGDDLGGPYDLVIVANLLPQFSAAEGVRLLRRLSAVLAPGGRLAVAGFTVGDRPPAEEFGARMLSLLMLTWTPGGEVHGTDTYLRMLDDAGYTGARVHDVPGLPTRIFVAETSAPRT